VKGWRIDWWNLIRLFALALIVNWIMWLIVDTL
jgi:hypothetical protein